MFLSVESSKCLAYSRDYVLTETNDLMNGWMKKQLTPDQRLKAFLPGKLGSPRRQRAQVLMYIFSVSPPSVFIERMEPQRVMETTRWVCQGQGNLCPASLWNSQSVLHQQGGWTLQSRRERAWDKASCSSLAPLPFWVPGLWLSGVAPSRDEEGWEESGLAGGEQPSNQDKEHFNAILKNKLANRGPWAGFFLNSFFWRRWGR